MKTKVIRGATAGLAGLWGAVILSRPLTENDLFWHLMLGRSVSREHARTVLEPSAVSWGVEQHLAVPEWLWDVTAWLSWSAGLLPLFVAACGFIAASVITFWVARPSSKWLTPVVTFFLLGALSARFKERPETLALALAAAFLIVGRGLIKRASVSSTVALLVLEVLWAQVHGTVVFAVPFFVVLCLDARVGELKRLALISGALVLGLFTQPAGLGFLDFLSSHASGDAVRHIIDMSAPQWSELNPATAPYHFIAVVLSLVAIAGVPFGIWRRSSLVMLGLGIGLALLSTRAVAWWAMCLAPQLMLSLTIFTRARSRVLSLALLFALSVASLAWVTVRLESRVGPFFAFTVRQTEIPAEALAAFAPLPRGAVIWTSFIPGAAVGFLADGQFRVTMDSRTPLHFDDVAYATYRDCRSSPTCLQNAVTAMNVQAAVVERGDECSAFAKVPGFVPVAVNARYAAFARGLTPLVTIDPCAPMYLTARACEPAFDDELKRLEPAGAAFTSFLREARALRCGAQVDVSTLERLLADNPRWPTLRVMTGMAELRAGNAMLAVKTLLPAVETHFPPALTPMLQALSSLDAATRAPTLAALSRTLDDQTPAALRTLAALTAAELGDEATARFEGTRAAAAGEKAVLPVLDALEKTSTSEAQRAELRGWIRALSTPN